MTAPQSNTTNGPPARALARWTASATSSLPVPGLALDEQRDVRGRDALQIREELAHAGRSAQEVSEAVARGLLALDRLRQGRQGELGVAQAKPRVRRQDGVVEARAVGEHSVGRSQVAHAHPARHRLELAMGARHAVVVEDQVVVVGGADLHALPRDLQRLARVGPAHHLDARLRVAHDDARTANARQSRAGRLRHLLRLTTRRARRRPGGCGRIDGVEPEAKAVRTVGRVRRMGRYTLYGKIASGGMATVHLGRLIGSSGFARTVAIKCLHPQFAQDPEFVRDVPRRGAPGCAHPAPRTSSRRSTWSPRRASSPS